MTHLVLTNLVMSLSSPTVNICASCEMVGTVVDVVKHKKDRARTLRKSSSTAMPRRDAEAVDFSPLTPNLGRFPVTKDLRQDPEWAIHGRWKIR